jgi:hypothetical protein
VPPHRDVDAFDERADGHEHRRLGRLHREIAERTAGHRSDITDSAVRSVVLPLGLVDVKVAALGDDWSGLRTVWRKELRPGLRLTLCLGRR